MALDTNDVEAIGRVIQTRITEYDQTIRAEINQAFTQTGEAFEMRLMQVVQAERELFFEALRQINARVEEIVTYLHEDASTATPLATDLNPDLIPVAPEDVPDDALGEDVVDDRTAPPTKGTIAPPTPITPSVFGDGH